eukprot:14597-Heterococcus_DN1.PRE.1
MSTGGARDQNRVIYLEEGWGEIKTGAIDSLQVLLNGGLEDKKTTKLFAPKEYVTVYTLCYNMCTQRSPYNWSEQLYQRHGDTFQKYLTGTVLPALRDKHGEFLLKELVRRWTHHKIMNTWMQKFFMYLDRYYVKHHNLPTLATAGLRHFKTLVYDTIKRDVVNAMMDMINKEREGGMVDKELLRSCVDLFESMGMGNLDAYSQDFEEPLLTNTREFYARKSQQWVENDSTPDYMVKAENALEAERARVASYLNSATEPKLLRVCDTEMLEKREQALLDKEGSGCRSLLKNEKHEDLSRMYRLFSRSFKQKTLAGKPFCCNSADVLSVRLVLTPLFPVALCATSTTADHRLANGLQPIAAIVKEHINAEGSDVIARREAKIADGEKDTNTDPTVIKELLALHDKHSSMVNNQFANHSLLQKALKEAFSEFVNKDVGKFKTADLMSNFCDRILKTGGEKLSDNEIDEYLTKVVQLFSYLTDKDLFAEMYRQQLAKRLLNQ